MTETPSPAASARTDRPDRADRPARAGWLAVGGLLAVAGIIWGTVNVVAQLAHEELDRTTSYPAEGIDELVVVSGRGRVEVTGAAPDAETITVRAHVTEGLARPTDHQEVINGRLELRTDCPGPPFWHCDIAYRVALPADRAVTISSGDGDVKVIGVDGTVRVDSDEGRIELAGLGGEVTVDNDDGRVEATAMRSATVTADNDNGSILISFVAAPRTVAARAGNGSVIVEVPDDGTAYALDAQTSNGATTVDVRTDPASDRRIEARSSNGSVRIRYT